MSLKKGDKVLCVENNSTIRPLVIESVGDKIVFSKQLDKGVKRTFSLKEGTFKLIKPRYISEHEKKKYKNPDLERNDRVKVIHVEGTDNTNLLGRDGIVISITENERGDREIMLYMEDTQQMASLELEYRMSPYSTNARNDLSGKLIQKSLVLKLNEPKAKQEDYIDGLLYIPEQTEEKKQKISPDLEVGDRIMAWDISPDNSPPNASEPNKSIPSTFIATVIDVLDIYNPAYENGIKYLVKIEDTDEVIGLYGGEWLGGSMYPIRDKYHKDTRDKWLKLPKIGITEETDIFGQGLLDPIEPEEFEGEDEEWEDLVDDVVPTELEPEYEYTGGQTDPTTGYVAPSAEVTDNICKVKGFCEAQGPITFGQLRELVKEATNKRISADIGRGVFKSLWRIIPFFVPQILLAAVGVTVTRAFNKIITPSLKNTRGYKNWWGKVVLKAMDIAEGDYIPDVALGDDPLSKIFFISDGLLEMIRDKYKLKFARYVADYASSRPDNEPVPEWFVENLLRDYLNQKFLLNPPLEPKDGTDFNVIKEHEEKDLDDNSGETTTHEPFTKTEAQILNYLTKEFTWGELNTIATVDETLLMGELHRKWISHIKLFGEYPSDTEETMIKSSRWAKWAIDNWEEAEVEIDGGGYSRDFKLVTEPTRMWPNWYEVDANESYWQKEYRSGTIEMGGYSQDDAEERAHQAWWEYDPDMDHYDYGDSDDHELEVQGARWIRTLKEHKESRINPELEVGDKILVVNVNREVEGKSIKYNIPPPELKPDLYVSYAVVGKESNGSESKYPFRYTLIPEDKYQEYLNGDYWVERDTAKLLFPWIYDWILDDEDIITEHKKSKISPDLDEGDTIRVIEVDGEHANMPEVWGIYKVYDVRQDNATQRFYYELSGETSEIVPDTTFSTTRLTNSKYLYHGDVWIPADIQMATNVDRKTISEHKESKVNPELKIGDEIIVLDVGVEVKNDMNKPDKYIRYFVTKIYGGNKWQEFDQPYYGLNRPDVDVTDPDNPGVYDESSTHKHLYPRTDTWMFNPKGPTMRYEDAFQPEVYMSDDGMDEEGGYLYEHKESKKLNPELMVGDEILVVGHGYEKTNQDAELYTPYQVVSIKQNNNTQETYYGLYPLEQTDDNLLASMLAGGGKPREILLYKEDNWVMRPGFLRGEGLNEQNLSAHYFQGQSNIMLKSPELEQDLKAFHGLELEESVPQPGSSSAEGFDDKDLPYETEYLTLGEILSRVENIAYYREVLKDLQDDKEDWTVTQTVKRYADYWMENPESITGPDFPPIQVIGNGMKDGSHRISTLNALAKHIDSDNPYWEDVKLEVRFYDPETVMASGHYYPWLWDISDEDLQQAIDDKVYNWEVLEKWLADPNAKSDLKKLRAESLNENKEYNTVKSNRVFVMKSPYTPDHMEFDHIGFITTDGRLVDMSGHRYTEDGKEPLPPTVYKYEETEELFDMPKLKDNAKLTDRYEEKSLPQTIDVPLTIPTCNIEGGSAENCGSYVKIILSNNNIKTTTSNDPGEIFKSIGQTITEQVSGRNMKGFTPKLIGYLKFIFETKNINNIDDFQREAQQFMGMDSAFSSTLYLILLYNKESRHNTIIDLLNDIPVENYEIPTIYEYNVNYYGAEEMYHEEEECDDDGTGEYSGEHCDCARAVKQVEDDEGYVTEEECEWNYDDDCECEEWAHKDYELYYNDICSKVILSFEKLENTEGDYTYGYEDLSEIENELGPSEWVEEYEECDPDYDDAAAWDYFHDKNGQIIGLDTDVWEPFTWDRQFTNINNKIYGVKPLIDIIEDQYDVMSDRDRKMKDLTSQIFDILDDNFDMFEHPEGEIEYDGKNMGLYSHHNDSFVPFEHIYNPIIQMLEGGIQQEDIEVFVEIITNWVNHVMSEKREYLNEEVNIKSDESNYSQEDYDNFVDFAHKELNIDDDCPIDVETEPSSEYTTGNYHIHDKKIKILDNGRKLADILRTIAHELVHHKQNELGMLVGDIPEIGGKIEDQANAYAGRIVKKYGKQTPNLYSESKKDILSEEKVVGFNNPNNNFVVIAGGPGAGKSFITRNLINLDNVKEFNVDQVRVMTAKKLWGDEWEEKISTEEGYDEILRRTFTTSDPRNLTVRFLKEFLQSERNQPVNVVYDAGGGQEQVMKDIHIIAKENGFNTTLVYVRTPLDVAQERNIERPRSLPPEMVAQYHQQVKDNMRNMIPIFDNVWTVDNKDMVDLSDRPSDNIEKIK